MSVKTKTPIKLLDDRVLIKPIEVESQTAAGLYLPESAKEKPMRGEVLAAGPGKINEDGGRTPVCVKAGDMIVYGKYAGTEVELEGGKYVLLRDSELLAKVEK